MLRKAHGNGASALVRVETAPADELPRGVSDPEASRSEDPADRGPGGLFARGNALASRAGKANKGKSRIAGRLGLKHTDVDPGFAPYKKAAAGFRKAQCSRLAKHFGGGECGPAPSSIVASAALSLAWSRYLYDLAAETGDVELATRAARFADVSAQRLLTAQEICAREAEARPKPKKLPWEST